MPAEISDALGQLQEKLLPIWTAIRDDDNFEHTSVIIPSLSVDQEELGKLRPDIHRAVVKINEGLPGPVEICGLVVLSYQEQQSPQCQCAANTGRNPRSNESQRRCKHIKQTQVNKGAQGIDAEYCAGTTQGIGRRTQR